MFCMKTQNLKILSLAILLVATTYLTGCSGSPNSVSSHATPPPQNQTEKAGVTPYSVEIYYYYDPECPNCRAVEPYMEFLSSHVKAEFDFCDLTKPETCSNMSKSLFVHAIKSLNISPAVPMAIIKSGNDAKVLLGRNKIPQLDRVLSEEYGIPSPVFKFGDMEYRLNDCIQCHKARNLPIPSKYECSSCCHDVNFQIEVVDQNVKFRME